MLYLLQGQAMFTTVILATAAFAISHSLLAALRVKGRLRQRFGDRAVEGLYRLLYNLISVVTLAPILLLVMSAPGVVVWDVQGPARWLLMSVQAVGVLGLLVSLLQIDSLRFAGISQAAAYFNGAPLPLPDETLQTGGIYRISRHPLYLFSLLALWPLPTMTESMLAFVMASTLYFVVGSILEEQKLEHLYGDIYRQYRAQVPWLLPIPIRRGG